MNIDVTMTAVIRPEVLENTLSSFFKYIFSSSYTYSLILNIDCIGDDAYKSNDVIDIAKKYFSSITCNISQNPNFPKAVKWVWFHSQSEFVFHLEDMWNARMSINFNDLVYVLDQYPDIANIFLFKALLADGSPEPTFYDGYKNYNDRRMFLQSDKPLLSPGLYRGEFLRSYANMMNDVDNPELQIWGDKETHRDGMADCNNKEYLSKWKYVIYSGNWKLPFWSCRKQVVDLFLGRQWKKRHGFKKDTSFSPWKRVECEK
jgi:hypothetical protein